jgi:hypothetical protein
MIKLTKKDKEEIRDIISGLTIVSVKQGDKNIWNCNGYETKKSKELNLTADIIRMDVDGILSEILKYLLNK